MKLTIKMIMMSHLSDVQEGFLSSEEASHRLNFVKFLILHYTNTNEEVDADEVYQHFLNKMKKRN